MNCVPCVTLAPDTQDSVFCNRYTVMPLVISQIRHAWAFVLTCASFCTAFTSYKFSRGLISPFVSHPPSLYSIKLDYRLGTMHTCHLALRVAGWVGPLPHLSSYTTGCGMPHTRWLIPYLIVIWVWHAPHSLAHPLLNCYPGVACATLVGSSIT